MNTKPIFISSWYGMYSLLGSHAIPDFYLANSLNLNQSDIGSISPSKQYSLFGNRIDADGRILSGTAFTLRDGTEVALRCHDDGTNTALEYYNSQATTWETLVGSLTTNKRMAFAPFNITTTNRIYFCNGVANLSFWNGATTYATAAYAGGTGTLSVADTTNFDSSGSIVVGGTTITYSAKASATSLTINDAGCPAIAVNAGVAQLPDTTTLSAAPKMDIMVVADRRIWGVVPTSPTRIVFCASGDGTNWTTGNNPTDPGTVDFPEGEGKIINISNIRENIILFKKDLIIAYKLNYESATARSEKIEVIREGLDSGAISANGVCKAGNIVYYATAKGGIKSVYLNTDNERIVGDDLTDKIRPTLADGVFTSSALVFWEKEKILLASFKKDSDSAYNDKCVAIQITQDENGNQHRALGIYDWLVNSWFKYNNDLYFGGSYEPNTFKCFDGYTKDGNPFNWIATLKRYSFGNMFDQKKVMYIPVMGWIASGERIKFELDYDTGGSRAHLTSTFDSLDEVDKDFIIQPEFNMIGAFELGTEPIGGTMSDISDLSFFRFFFVLPEQHHPFDIQLSISGDGSSSTGEIVGNRVKIEKVGFMLDSADFEVDKSLKKNFS